MSRKLWYSQQHSCAKGYPPLLCMILASALPQKRQYSQGFPACTVKIDLPPNRCRHMDGRGYLAMVWHAPGRLGLPQGPACRQLVAAFLADTSHSHPRLLHTRAFGNRTYTHFFELHSRRARTRSVGAVVHDGLANLRTKLRLRTSMPAQLVHGTTHVGAAN